MAGRLLALEMGAIGCPETSVTTNIYYITSQKSNDLIYVAAETWRHFRCQPIHSDVTV
jgi:uncharacterized protein YhbP (UPF0306 family)